MKAIGVVIVLMAVLMAALGSFPFAFWQTKRASALEPIASYRMEEANGTRVDSTSHGNDLAESAATGSGVGIIGDAVDFSGTTYLEDASFADSDGTGYNVTLWFTYEDAGLATLLPFYLSSGGGEILYVQLNPGDPQQIYCQSAGDFLFAGAGLDDGNFHCFQIEVSAAGAVRVWIDGAEDGDHPTFDAAAFDGVTVGNNFGGAGSGWIGRIDAVVIINGEFGVLGPTQAQLYNGGAGHEFYSGDWHPPL